MMSGDANSGGSTGSRWDNMGLSGQTDPSIQSMGMTQNFSGGASPSPEGMVQNLGTSPSQEGGRFNTECNVYVYGFPPEWQDMELQTLFSQAGTISSVKVARAPGGNSKGYGFVAFADNAAANMAIQNLNGYDCGNGKCLQVRIKSAKGEGQGPPGAGGMKAGDWICPTCHDHQFARNATCRKCNTPNPNPVGFGGQVNAMMGGGAMAGGASQGYSYNTGSNVMNGNDGGMNGCFGQGAMQPQQMQQQMQQQQMQQQPLPDGWMEVPTPDGQVCYMHTATKTTTWERPVSQDNSGGMQMGMQAGMQTGMQAGMPMANQSAKFEDWVCPGCGDHQFARNQKCRKCGTPNPSGGGTVSGDSYSNEANIYVYGINPEWSEYDLNTMFAGCGTIVSSKIGRHLDGGSKGYAFVAFDSPIGAQTACSSFDGYDVGNGRLLQVKPKDTSGGKARGKTSGKPGDWNCPSCGDHQFARNAACRRCGTPMPQQQGMPGMQMQMDMRSSPY